jgi:RNA polymerase sigma-70 factor (ECF subfamily)
MADDSSHASRLRDCLDRLRAGDLSARDALIEYSWQRLDALTHRLLQTYPQVRRWEDTSDVRQNAAQRLYRALAEVPPDSVEKLMGLAALCIRRELLDLKRHYYGPQGSGAHHHTDVPGPQASDFGGTCAGNAQRPAPATFAIERLEIHELVSRLPDDERRVFELRYYLDCTHAEAAEVLNLAEITVRRRWQSARLLLHQALDELRSGG